MEELKVGQLVRSLAGRDKGEHYLVLEVLTPREVLVVNGNNRTLSRPKKKNTVHLQQYERAAELEPEIRAQTLTDSRVISFLKELAPQEEVYTGGLSNR